jgi:hypothetical protein
VATFWIRTLAVSAEHDVSENRIAELRQALEDLGAREVLIKREVTFLLDAPSSADALTRADEVLLRLSWPTTVMATQI